MAGLVHSLFGGSDAQQTSQATSTPTNFTDPSLSGLAPDLAGSLKQILASFGNQATTAGTNPTGTPLPQAPVTGQEGSLLNSINGQVGPGTASAGYIRDVLNGNYLPGQASANPFLSSAISAAQRPTLQGLTETLSRALPGRFTAGGQFIQPNTGDNGGSSAFDRAAAIATRGAADATGDIATNISNNQYQQERQQQTVAAGLDQSEVDHTIAGLQASALPRLIQQNGLDQGVALFQKQTQNLLDVLKSIGAITAPTIANTSQSTSQGTSTKDNGIVPALFPKGL